MIVVCMNCFMLDVHDVKLFTLKKRMGFSSNGHCKYFLKALSGECFCTSGPCPLSPIAFPSRRKNLVMLVKCCELWSDVVAKHIIIANLKTYSIIWNVDLWNLYSNQPNCFTFLSISNLGLTLQSFSYKNDQWGSAIPKLLQGCTIKNLECLLM